jgi:fluoroquinolone transport system permease protein
MKRLLATLWCDVRLQFRNGVYLAATFVALFLAGAIRLLVRWLPPVDLGWWLPGLVLSNMLINTFYFVGGLVLLEKGEGTLEAQVVTPLRSREYLTSKVMTLAGLALVENLVVVGLGSGLRFSLGPFVLGVMLITATFGLYGFLVVVRYDSINEYLFPSLWYTPVVLLPLLDYFGVWRSWLFYLHPVQAPLLVLRAAFQPIELWQWLYSLLYGGLWLGAMLLLSERSFQQFVVRQAGVR